MILRKPYAFLIKHFKLIHIFLSICVCFIVIKTWEIYSFLGEFIANDQYIVFVEDISSNYVSGFLLFVIGFLIILNSVVLYLMKHKKKPVLFYISNLIIYIMLFVFLLFTSGFIYDLQFSTPDLRITKLIKDIYFGAFLVQIPVLVFSIIRGIGFDIKKFDFKHDLMDFNLSDEDNAEFEFELNLDTEDLRAKVRKGLRYFKYFFKENKIVFITIFTIIGMFFTIKVVNYVSSIEKVYKENEMFETSTFKIEVVDTYKTYYDFKGNEVSKGKDYFFVILKLKYYNKSADAVSITIDNAKLRVDKYNDISPIKGYYNKFSEFGVGYYEQNLLSNQEREFILIYKVKNEFYNNDLQLKYLYAINFVKGDQVEYQYRTVSLKPEEVNDFGDDFVSEVKLGEELVFEDSFFGNTKLTVKSMELDEQFRFKEVYCFSEGSCTDTTKVFYPLSSDTYSYILMRLEYDLEFDSTLFGSEYFVNNFIEDYGSIRFIYNGKEYSQKVGFEDVVPTNLDYINRNYTYLNVLDRLYKAEEIYLDFTIRNKTYTYVLREKVSNDVKNEEATDKK